MLFPGSYGAGKSSFYLPSVYETLWDAAKGSAIHLVLKLIDAPGVLDTNVTDRDSEHVECTLSTLKQANVIPRIVVVVIKVRMRLATAHTDKENLGQTIRW